MSRKEQVPIKDDLEQHFDIDVQALLFINENPFLRKYLHQALSILEAIFGKDAILELRLIKDPEIANYQTLYCNIWVSVSIDEALDKLDAFDDEYYLKLPNDVTSYLNFNVRCR
ncbi:MAG: hypothetical protein Q9P01_07835 [Anaerolineae bacterium]|nr:hypothetical protein [Anaerolineae bacterium]MDQ7034736.1 hypothetical protein [Anaerolineae bacterium]